MSTTKFGSPMPPADERSSSDTLLEAAVKAAARLAISAIYPACEVLFSPPRADVSGPPPARRILVIQRDFLGDVLFTTPMLRALRARYPEARIDVLVRPHGQEALAGNPHVDAVHVEGTALTRRDRLGEYVGFWRLALRLRRQRYDLVFDLTKGKAFAHALLTALTGAPIRVGIQTWERAGFVWRHGFPLCHNVEVPTRPNQHLIDYFLDTVRILGAEAKDRRMELQFDDSDRAHVADVLHALGAAEHRPLVVIHPGANRLQNRMAPDRVARLCADLWMRHRARVILIGVPAERSRLEGIAAQIPDPRPSLVVDLSLRQLAALLERCDLFLSGDSGPLRIADIAGAPMVSWFGSANPANTRPLGDACLVLTPPLTCCPCYEFTVQAERAFERCPVRCIDLIPLEEILSAAASQLRVGRAAGRPTLGDGGGRAVAALRASPTWDRP